MTALPERIAVFPLIGVLLLPAERLPLNVVEDIGHGSSRRR